jgi:hypothetical protein
MKIAIILVPRWRSVLSQSEGAGCKRYSEQTGEDCQAQRKVQHSLETLTPFLPPLIANLL